DDIGYSIAADASSNVYLTGYFMGTVDFDPSSATVNLVSAGGQDVFMAKYDASGNYVWAKAMGGTSTEIAYSIALDALNNIYLAGYFFNTADFDPGAGTANLTSASVNISDAFFAKYDASGNYVWAKAVGGTDVEFGRGI